MTATIPLNVNREPQQTFTLAQAEGRLGESMRFVLDSLRRQMDDAGVRELAAGNRELKTITITTELFDEPSKPA